MSGSMCTLARSASSGSNPKDQEMIPPLSLKSPRSVTAFDRVLLAALETIELPDFPSGQRYGDGGGGGDGGDGVCSDDSEETLVIPPLFSVRVPCDETDCISSLSSMDSMEENELDVPRRSIFGSYWKKLSEKTATTPPSGKQLPEPEGGEPLALSQLQKLKCRPMQTFSYEEALRQREAWSLDSSVKNRPVKTQTNSNGPQNRRSIWSNSISVYTRRSESVAASSSLLKSPYDSNSFCKSKSDPVFDRQRKPSSSCLRECRYSGGSNGSDTARRREPIRRQSSVRFHGEVDVVHLEKSLEQWADESWSQWFT